MAIRKLFYYWQFIAVIALPLWLVVGWPIFGEGGWGVFGVFFAAAALGIALLVVSLLIYARKDVRLARAVSWPDVGVLALWHALIIASGFYAASSPWLSVLVIVVGLFAFWFSIWEFVDSARRAMRATMDQFEAAARPQAPHVSDMHDPAQGTGFTRTPDPNVIIVQEQPREE